MKKKETKRQKPPVATLTIRGAWEFSTEDKYNLTCWLFKQINDLWADNDQYAPVFTARYKP